ncbi:acetyl-CoA carboxylase carboxyltransferase subunit alpha [Fodinisporobacter ferrooxydans]|uniref:Acetyl-coenzyme A carboxylase carboxyl transferase subunit alpha n=1 Tax=Fodinisporobacter ferrooxydans TaxID=2901836 RepID=A0ABY4CRQ1_9BACL|nr:acetyl-CoA carboxylase carboxyltransferase subunit alpha [Alicyclobacillaceae bacterium MYW30-H2]
MAGELLFEKPLLELRQKIEELKKFTLEKGIDFSDEVQKLEQRAHELEQQIYGNLTPYQKLQIARSNARPTALNYINGMCSDFIELHGDRSFRDDPALVGGVGKLDGMPVTVIGIQKGHDTKENLYRNFGMVHPEGYRKALRLMKQAEKFQRPVVCLIDTPGAYPGISAEERNQSEAIARNLLAMANLRVPVVSVVTGEGASGGALALGIADRVYMLEHAWYCVIAPESAAAILWKDASQSQRAADSMRITAQDLKQFGIIDGIVPEPLGGAHKDPEQTIQATKQVIVDSLKELCKLSIEELLANRYDKYKSMGQFLE